MDLTGWMLRWQRRQPDVARSTLTYAEDDEGGEGSAASSAAAVSDHAPRLHETRVTMTPRQATLRPGAELELLVQVEAWNGTTWTAAPDDGTVMFSFEDTTTRAQFVGPTSVVLSGGTGAARVRVVSTNHGQTVVCAQYWAPWKEVELTGSIEPSSYFVLARLAEETVRGAPIGQIYDLEIPHGKYFSPAGDVVSLLDGTGTVVDTANADRQQERDGWVAGYGADGGHCLGTMERIDLHEPDTDDNWGGNRNIFTTCLDQEYECIVGTPRSINERTLIHSMQERDVRVVWQGSTLTLSGFVPDLFLGLECLPRATIMEMDPTAAGGERVMSCERQQLAIVKQSDPDRRGFEFVVNTGMLEPGEYTIWITMGGGTFHMERIRVVTP